MPQTLPLPKHHQVYVVLREQLDEGRFSAGVPGELHLMREFGVGRVTVRRALERLVDDGLIRRSPGRGTVAVARSSTAKGTGAAAGRRPPLGGLLGNIVSMSLRTTIRVLQCELLPASDLVARHLGVAPGAPVQKAVRVRSTRAGPMSHITTHVPEPYAGSFGRRELGRKPILVLLEEAGVEIGGARQSLSARLADAAVARALEIEVGSALLAVQRLVFDANERPVQWLQGLYRPDRYAFEMQLSRVGGIDAKVWASTELQPPFH